MRGPILPRDASLTFADYFKLNAELEDILAELGYSLVVESSHLPRTVTDSGRIAELKERLEKLIPHVGLTNETARREFLIAPILTEIVLFTDAKIRVEYALEVDDHLKGTLDYFLRAAHNMLVVEAKNADLERGFTQLAVELVALDRWCDDSPDPRLYGAVSVGNVWQFGFLDRSAKKVTKDITTYGIPDRLEEVFGTLAAILND